MRMNLVTIIKSYNISGDAGEISGVWFHHKYSCKPRKGNSIGITTEATTKLPHIHGAGD